MITINFEYESMERLSIVSDNDTGNVVVPRIGEHLIIEFFKYKVEDVTHKFENNTDRAWPTAVNQTISVTLSRLM